MWPSSCYSIFWLKPADSSLGVHLFKEGKGRQELIFINYPLDATAQRRQWHPHSSTLAWKIPWTEEPGRLQSMGLLRVGHDWACLHIIITYMYMCNSTNIEWTNISWQVFCFVLQNVGNLRWSFIYINPICVGSFLRWWLINYLTKFIALCGSIIPIQPSSSSRFSSSLSV